MTAKKKTSAAAGKNAQGSASNKYGTTASGKTDADFNALARRVARMEREMAALKKQGNAQAPKAKRLRLTKRDIAEAQARSFAQAELGYVNLISTNVLGDLDRLLHDRIYAGIGSPRAGYESGYEELRLATASSLVSSFADESRNNWANFEPAPNQPFSHLPPQQARQWLIAYLRSQVENNLPGKAEHVADGMSEDVFVNQRPSRAFDRSQAPKAAEEGAELAKQVIFNVFDQLEQDTPGYGIKGATAESTRGVQIVHESLSRTVTKYRPPKPLSISTHEELFADCYTVVTLKVIEAACNYMGSGTVDPVTDHVIAPLRMAGSVLTELGISQRANPDNLDQDDLDENGIDNGVPNEKPAAMQIREMIRVLDVMQDSLYDGELQQNVRALYAERAAEIFPGQPLREIEGTRFEASGWKDTRKVLEQSNKALFHLAQKEDGWSQPRKSPPPRTGWTFASSTLQ